MAETGKGIGAVAEHAHALMAGAARQLGAVARIATSYPRRAWQAVAAKIRPNRTTSQPNLRGIRQPHRRPTPMPRPPVGDFSAARLAADEGLEALGRALGDPDPKVRTLALDVVCEFSAERAARLLAAMVHDLDPSVRCAAAAAAARLGAPRTVSSLIVALDDPDSGVRAASAQAIEAITGRRIAMEDDPATQRRQIEELKRWWKEERLAQLTASLQHGGLP